jgi:hypothetical protein
MHLNGGLVADAHHVWFGKTVIWCCYELDYETAERIVGGVVATDGTSGGGIPACPLRGRERRNAVVGPAAHGGALARRCCSGCAAPARSRQGQTSLKIQHRRRPPRGRFKPCRLSRRFRRRRLAIFRPARNWRVVCSNTAALLCLCARRRRRAGAAQSEAGLFARPSKRQPFWRRGVFL